MAWYPLADKKVITPGPNDPPIIVVGAILHVDAGDSSDLFNYFSTQSGGIESHFHVPKVGPIQQYRDTHFEADANLKANSFLGKDGKTYGFVSVETQGFEKGEWNPHQLDNIKLLLKWLHETHNFPLKKCDNPQGPGVGYHTMFGAPGPWTPNAKTCPGADRIRQFNSVLVPWFSEGHAPAGTGGTPGSGAVNVDEVLKQLAALEAHLKEQDRISLGRMQRQEEWSKVLLAAAKNEPAEPPVVGK